MKDDSFSYYNSAADVYFPAGTIDLRYAIKAELSGPKSTTSSFIIITEQRTYYFKTDSPSSAHEWVKSLQKEIFRSKNEGDTVKIVIPIENIIDIEDIPMFDIGETLKIKAIDSDETYAIDEYVLAFFSHGQEARDAIKSLIRSAGLPSLDNEVEDLEKSSRTIKKKVFDTTTSYIADTPAGYHSPRRNATAPMETKDAPERLTSRLRSLTIGSLGERRSRSPLGAPLRGLTGIVKSGVNTVSGVLPDFRESKVDTAAAEESADDDDISGKYDMMSSAEESSSSVMTAVKNKRKPPYPFQMVNKMTEMWEGGTKHFRGPNDEEPSIRNDQYLVSQEDQIDSNRRFRSHFSLGEEDRLVAAYYTHIQKSFPIYGKIYLSNRHLCFRSLIPGTRTKMILPVKDIENVTKEKGFRFGYSGLVVIIHGHEEVFFEFGSSANRDDCEMMILRVIDHAKKTSTASNSAHSSGYLLRNARLCTYEDALHNENHTELPPVLIEDTVRNECATSYPTEPIRPFHVTFLTIGSRGDVQPYIALGKGMLAEGHTVRIATHIEFKDWIQGHGIEFREVAGDPGELMKIMVDHGMFSVAFIREASAKFRTWIDELLKTSWEACQGTDILVESPSAMAGIHVAEALQIPYYRAFTMPWTKTRAYPHAFIVPEQKMGGSYNALTYVLFDNVFWKGISSQVNKWRVDSLGLERTTLDQLQQWKVPFLYNVSPSIFVPPLDFSDWITVTGYWFLEEGGKGYEPAEDLTEFINRARDDGKKLVYIGFGSIVVSDPKELTKAVVKSVQRAGVRCILSKGWSNRLGSKNANIPEVELPPEIFQIQAAPHDWLFPQMDAAVHHGGSGTTGASLRAGLPTIIKPFFGDQFFYAGRVEDLGAGIHLKKMTVNSFSKALWDVTHDERIINKATAIGKSIRSENGVAVAIGTIYRSLDYAKSLIKPLPKTHIQHHHLIEEDTGDISNSSHATDDSWTMVDND